MLQNSFYLNIGITERLFKHQFHPYPSVIREEGNNKLSKVHKLIFILVS